MLDVKKLRRLQNRFVIKEQQAFFEKLDPEIIQFVISKFFKNHFTENKTLRQTQQSARVLNNWSKQGIIPLIDSKNGKRRQFNKVESIWLQLATSCREFGLPLEKIKNLREYLFEPILKKFTPLEYAMMFSIVDEPMILVFFESGDINLMPKSLYLSHLNKLELDMHIHFNLVWYLQNEFPSYNNIAKAQLMQNTQVTSKELELLYFLRTGDFDSVKVKLKNGDILFLEGHKKIPTKSKVIDVIKKQNYQTIQIEVQNGEIVHFTTVEKRKI